MTDELTGPAIEAATIGAGHDGRAEVVLTLRYPNGGRSILSVAEEELAPALDAAGLTTLEQLVGQHWTVLGLTAT